MLDAPFPFIIGMKKSHKEKWHLLDISNSSLIVLLDKGEIFQTEESMISVFPALINSGNNIKNNYKEFSKRFYEVESHEINMKCSGIGREGGKDSYHFFTEVKSITVKH